MSREDSDSIREDVESQGSGGRSKLLSRHVTFRSNSNASDIPAKRYIGSTRERSLSAWRFYCYLITWWVPRSLLSLCGMKTKERRVAWREKIGLLSIIFYIGVFVTYLTFGLSSTLCNYSRQRLLHSEVAPTYIVINGAAYEYMHNYSNEDNPDYIMVTEDSLYGPSKYGGKDASFLFQNVNGNCQGLITPRNNCTIPIDEEKNIAWYFPCLVLPTDPLSNVTDKNTKINPRDCHLSNITRSTFYELESEADVYYTWQEVKNDTRNLVVYNGDVLDLELLDWILTKDLDYPQYFDELRGSNLQGYDISLIINTNYEKQIGRCLSEIIKVGEIESQTIGCIAADVVLYVALTLILGAVFTKFIIACYFHWVIAKVQGATKLDSKSMQKHNKAVEEWSENINIRGPLESSTKSVSTASRLSKIISLETALTNMGKRDSLIRDGFSQLTSLEVLVNEATESANKIESQNKSVSASLNDDPVITKTYNRGGHNGHTLHSSLLSENVIQQPGNSFMPFNFPLIHTLCLVTCYSEDKTGLRTTLDSLAITDYPNSHKLIFVICDGLIKGSGNAQTTPDIVLDMVEDYIIPRHEVYPHSYIAVTSGLKRHNMAKVYSGFYKYDNDSIPLENQQRVPMVVVVKCGTSEEQLCAKPGNRGKRDSQIILMSFLQKLIFNERMTRLDFEILVNIWRITGLMADVYEAILMVDADTKVFPDSLTHMVAELVKDPEIMGLCGETKIANKKESWVTAIQVFEYYISHHQIKAFESVFCSVTCLPGCFSMYRIKSPKGSDGLWIPILVNPDIVEKYSENDVTTLHKKNLLLLGEDRYLTSLMLKTFPKRKQIFVPKAACKTVVPSKFSVLLSQRRRWINSTVHNLFELVLVKDLCGTFCFSMQFIIIIELIGTLVLPLAICFTMYVIGISIFSSPTPTMTLCLLALILGLPGALVVVTVSSFSYVLWMLIYILALPIWNFILPTYAYWKFDDFSWGDTRKVAGENANNGHDESNSEFEHSMIRMKTWEQFEKEMTIQSLPTIEEVA
ncbi:similar to Saccharomyces cerevisiae YBR023C CHS3 Chitin synthase III, catalyzes the transfer of N-acetylglucosamine (GlcNAc) to chitin [Maudiozyma saulgeensis]|uniref:chitin synthase n=1 Tax=Maudiozyma saulgeensis TaxID=1789683 RepID=A0A1X7R749_9SACH|nr:similar to Saccharomyces cerevisiae YBR023C CHS3 Chitin synthase III, catalyzes the transfer of N-acetylglucosamine (GlcNAc) to chitin [Kazachstania saulgeensis]